MIAGVPKCPHLEWELLLTQFQALVLTPSLSGIQRSGSSGQSFRIRRGKDMEKKKDKVKGKEGEVKGREKRQKESNGEGKDEQIWCQSPHCPLKPIADLVACEVLEAMGSLYHQHTTQCLVHRRYSTHASSLGGKKGTPRSCRLFIRFPGMAGLSLSLLFSRAYISWNLHSEAGKSTDSLGPLF